MRQDMAKVIVERPRMGGGRKYREHRGILKRQLEKAIRTDDFDDLGTHEGMREWASIDLGYDRKQLNENLNPLRRFIRGCVGRNYDDVFSEICQVMDTRSACQYHIWQHAKDYIEINTFLKEDGSVWYNPDRCGYLRWTDEYKKAKWSVDKAEPINESYAEVYVDPTDKTLKLVPERKKYVSTPRVYSYRVEISKDLQAHWLLGAWYLVEISEIPPYVWLEWNTDEKVKYAELIESKTYYGYDRGELANFKINKEGRWVERNYFDVAFNDIVRTCNEINKYKDNHYSSGFTGVDIYGRAGVYGSRRWQMSRADLRKYGLKHVAGRDDGYSFYS